VDDLRAHRGGDCGDESGSAVQTRGPANRFGFDGTGKNLTDVALRTRIATDAVRW